MLGYSNHSSVFYPSSSSLQGLASFSAPHRQFVYDSSISGVSVPSSLTVNGSSQSKGSDLRIDFLHGQAIFASTTPSTVSGSYSAKEVNIYFTSQSAQEILLENKHQTSAKHASFTGFSPEQQPIPGIFIQVGAGNNKRLCFDSLTATTIPVSMVFIADNVFTYRAVTSAIRDYKDKSIPIFSAEQMPFNYQGDITGSFDYSAMATAIQADPYNLGYVKEVRISDLNHRINDEIGPNIRAGLIDVDIELLRFPI